MKCKIKYEITENIIFECFLYPLNYVTILQEKRGRGTSWLGTILTYKLMATKQHNKTHKECSFWNLKELIPKEKTQTFFLNCAFIQTSKKFKSGKCNYDRDIICS